MTERDEIVKAVRALAKEALKQESRAMAEGDDKNNNSTWWCAKVNAYNHVLVDVLHEKPEELGEQS